MLVMLAQKSLDLRGYWK